MDDAGKTLSQLKNDLAGVLLEDSRVKTRKGLPTGLAGLDESLLWKGFPQGELSLLSGPRGLGLASLCARAMEKVQQGGRWCAWINSDWSFFPTVSMTGLDPAKLLIVEKPTETKKGMKKLFWLLQEMISSSLFEFIGCHLSEFHFRASDLARLKSLARGFQVALVFLTETEPRRHSRMKPRLHSLFALILEVESGDRLILQRALHRQTPRRLQGVLSHARVMPAVPGRSRTLLG